MLLQLQDSILRLFLLNLKLFRVVNTTKSRILIIKIAKIFLKTIAIFILTNKENNTKNCLYIKVSINLQYQINYYLTISIKVFQLVKLAILTKKQKEDLIIIILKSIICIVY